MHYRDIRKSIAKRGVAGTLRYALRWPSIVLNERKVLAARNLAQQDFDRRHGTDTAGFINLSSFAIDNPNWMHGVRYGATSPGAFGTAWRLLGLGRNQFRDFTFVDVGSGKGAVLLYAAELPFKAIIGIEFVAELHDIAQRNIAGHPLAAGRVSSVLADATTYSMPSGPLLVFFNFPFSSEDLMLRVLRNIARSEGGPKLAIAMNFPFDPTSPGGVETRLIARDTSGDRATYAFEIAPSFND